MFRDNRDIERVPADGRLLKPFLIAVGAILQAKIILHSPKPSSRRQLNSRYPRSRQGD